MDVVEKSLLNFVQDMPADDLTMLVLRRISKSKFPEPCQNPRFSMSRLTDFDLPNHSTIHNQK